MATSSLLLLFAIGLAALLLGSELMVRGALQLAQAMRMPPLVIGMTVVAIGTSSPEFAIGIEGALRGQTDLTLGNVVGSSISNVLLILGLIAIIRPLRVARRVVRLDLPLMIGVALALLGLAWDGRISRGEGICMLLAGITYVVLIIRNGTQAPDHPTDDDPVSAASAPTPVETAPSRPGKRDIGRQLVLILAGLALLVWGSDTLVLAASDLARSLGISELVIGLTIIAVGTSLPEIATGIIAAVRGEGDLAVGNIVGSGIFNVLLVLGLTAVIAAGGVPVPAAMIRFDIPVVIAVALACLPIFYTGHRISRREGAAFVAYYLAYAGFLLMDASRHDAIDTFGMAMRWVVLPLTALTLAIVLVRALLGRDPQG